MFIIHQELKKWIVRRTPACSSRRRGSLDSTDGCCRYLKQAIRSILKPRVHSTIDLANIDRRNSEQLVRVGAVAKSWQGEAWGAFLL